MTFIPGIHPMLDVPRGNVPGITGLNKFGRTTNADEEVVRDVWDLTTQPIWVAPTTARIHNIASTSASDASAGVGARTIRIFGLTSWSTPEVSEDITMNGTSNVPTVNSYVIIYRMLVLTKGSSGPNVGTITATAQTDATITAQINPGQGQTQMAIFGVPSTQTFYMAEWEVSLNRAGGLFVPSVNVDSTLKFNPEPDAELTGFLIKHTQSSSRDGTSNVKHPFSPYKVFPGPGIIKIQVTADQDNTDISAGFDGYLVDN